jgi:Tfp pilus assembly protein PilV
MSTGVDVDTRSGESGVGLVEALIATFITAVGVLSVAGLFLVGVRMQANATAGSTAWAVATAELERIRTLAPTAAERIDGGTLTGVPEANHWAQRGRLMVRWRIENKANACAPIGGVPGAPTECAKNIQLIAISPNAHAIQARIDSVLFR